MTIEGIRGEIRPANHWYTVAKNSCTKDHDKIKG